MKIKKYYLTKSDNTRRMEKLVNVENIIITASKYKGFSGLKNRNIIEMSKYRDDKEFSCHYIIGLSGEIINIIPERERAICSRNEDIDEKSISIMMCIDKNGDILASQMKSLRDLVKKIIDKYDISRDNVLTEYDINCSRRPLIFVDEPIILDDLLSNKMPRVIL